MLKIKDDVDLKELEKFGFKMIPEGIYAKSLKIARSGRDSDMTEWFVTVEKEKDIFYFWNERKIVDLRSDTTVFFDIEDYNKNMFEEKLLWIVFVFPVFWLFCTVFFLLFILIKNWDADSRTDKKKK